MFLRIGKRNKVKVAKLYLDEQELRCVEEIKYLGVYIKSGNYFKCSYVHCKLKFYRSFNAIYQKSKSASSERLYV